MRTRRARLQRRAWEILERGRPGDAASQACDWLVFVLIVANVLAIVLESVASIGSAWAGAFAAFEAFSVALFTIEYLLRLWAAPAGARGGGAGALRARLRYALGFHGLVDLAATLPFYLQFLFPGLDARFLRLLRMVRILKLSHYNSALEELLSAIRDERRSFFSALYLLAIALLMSGCLAYYAEHEAQPDKFASIPEALWWSIVTLTTVGYGDVAPVTTSGKAVGALTALSGVCTVALLTGIVATAFSNQVARRKAIFESELASALRDGEISGAEARELEALRRQFGLSEELARALARSQALSSEARRRAPAGSGADVDA